MEKTSLKELFFIGSDEEIEEFVGGLKARCLKPTDKAIKDEEGNVLEKLIFNTEDQTYVSQHMKKYQVCPVCGELEEVDGFRTLELTSSVWYKKPGARLFTKSERVCHNCAANKFVENFYDAGHYLPVEKSVTLYRTDGSVAHAPKRDGYYRGFEFLFKFDEQGVLRSSLEELIECDSEEAVSVRDGSYGYVRKVRRSDLDLRYVARCSNCGDWWIRTCLDANGKCPSCSSMKIYNYHSWPESRTFKHGSAESVSNSTLYFGTEIETEGSRANANLVSPLADIFHLERDGSLAAESFEMISQPMTWDFIMENKDRIEETFNNLVAHGQKSHESGNCGLHIHVSRAALDGDRAEKRILAIVHGMRDGMKRFARRSSNWARYDETFNGKSFDEERIDVIAKHGHNVAVNCSNSESQKNTVEFRIFKGTLNMTTYLASIQFVKNIVDAANSNKVVVRFEDLLVGEYIEKYIQEQARYRDLHSDEYVNFAQCILGKKIGEFALNHTREEFQEIVTVMAELGGFGNVSVSFPTEADDQEGGDE